MHFCKFFTKSLFAANVIADFDYSIFLKAFDKSRYFSLLYNGTVCHVCGAEFDTSYDTSAFFAHDKAHMLAGEGSGYHNDTRKVQVGTNTVNVPEEGHYEKKLVKAAWDEKVLVKEAGWY